MDPYEARKAKLWHDWLNSNGKIDSTQLKHDLQ